MKTVSLLVVVSFLAVLSALPAGATELFADFSIGNLGFSRERDPGDQGLPDDSYPWGVSLGIRHPAFETVDFEMVLQRHYVLGTSAEMLLSHRSDFIELGVGPYVGIYNVKQQPFLALPGIHSRVRFNLARFGFISLAARAPLYDDPSKAGEYRQLSQEYAFGIFVPNVILGFHYGVFSFDEQTDDELIRDLHRAYELRAHVFQKAAPYRIDLTFGFHDYEKEFRVAGETQAFGALVLGSRVTVDVRPTLEVYLDLMSALYSFGRAELLGTDGADAFLFRAGAGMSYTFAPAALIE